MEASTECIRRICHLWKQRMEASTSTDSGKFHVFPWKLPLTPLRINLLAPTSMYISMEVNLLPNPWDFLWINLLPLPWKLVETSMEVERNNMAGPFICFLIGSDELLSPTYGRSQLGRSGQL